MTVDEAEKYADKMTYREAIENALSAKCVPYRRATLTKLHRLLKKFGENVDVLDKISAEIKEKAFTEEIFDEETFKSTYTENVTREIAEEESVIDTEIVKLSDILEIIEKYKEVSTFDCGKDPG